MERAIDTLLFKGYAVSCYPKDEDGEYRVLILDGEGEYVADSYGDRPYDAFLSALSDMVPDVATEEEESGS